MKSVVIYQSFHHGNTEKVAKALAQSLGAELKKPGEVENLAGYDLIGLGSGIYFWHHHHTLLQIANKGVLSGKKVFIFSTAGFPVKFFGHFWIKRILKEKGAEIVGEFQCPGFDTYGILKKIGGMFRGRPSDKDLKNAREFALNLKAGLDSAKDLKAKNE